VKGRKELTRVAVAHKDSSSIGGGITVLALNQRRLAEMVTVVDIDGRQVASRPGNFSNGA